MRGGGAVHASAPATNATHQILQSADGLEDRRGRVVVSDQQAVLRHVAPQLDFAVPLVLAAALSRASDCLVADGREMVKSEGENSIIDDVDVD